MAGLQQRGEGIAFILFVRFPAREAAPSGAPDSARALDCGAADFHFWEIGHGGSSGVASAPRDGNSTDRGECR